MKAIWGITKGETKQHIYCINKLETIEYPIRLCNWTIPENDFIEVKDKPKCIYCSQALEGKRRICFAPKDLQITESLFSKEG